MGQYDKTLGALLIGISFNTYMYGIVFAQYAAYYIRNFDDPKWIRALVISLFCLDTFSSSSLIYVSWVYMVQNFDNPPALNIASWPLSLTMLINVVTRISGADILGLPASSPHKLQTYLWPDHILLRPLLGGAALIQLRRNLTAHFVYRFSEGVHATTVVAVYLCFEFGVDVLIAGLLVSVLTRSSTGFHASKTITNRLIRGALQTGLFTGIGSVLTVVFFFQFPMSHMYAIVGFPHARFYTSTIMDTLLVRHGLREAIKGSRPDTSAIWELENLERFPQSTNSGSVQLHIRTEVYSDAHGGHSSHHSFSGTASKDSKHPRDRADPESFGTPTAL
ncbi:hypothetical protein FPV67DRAFT_1698025 [Lyophyllum atratum]|nr:hypothetical protein FPV67DRAFT_1698025 [Lyophyllum atratum]